MKQNIPQLFAVISSNQYSVIKEWEHTSLFQSSSFCFRHPHSSFKTFVKLI